MQSLSKLDEFIVNAIICLLYMVGLSSLLLVAGGLLKLWKWLSTR